MSGIGKTIRHTLGYWSVRALLAGARAAPLGVLRAGGALIGKLALLAARRDRRLALEHLAHAFPDRDETWRNGVLQAMGRHLGVLLGEVGWLWSAAPGEILARTEFVGLENLTGPLTPTSGVILVTAHCGNWEWENLALGASGIGMSVAAREADDPRIDSVARTLRGRFGGESALRGKGAGAKLVSALKRGRVVGLLIDQDIDAPGVFAEFFGRPAWTPSGAAVLALRTASPIVTGFACRLPDGRMRLAFDPPIPPSGTGDLDADAARITALLTARIEAQVRAHPEQWVWMHRRWRRKPAGDERVWRAETVPL